MPLSELTIETIELAGFALLIIGMGLWLFASVKNATQYPNDFREEWEKKEYWNNPNN